jgi:hypothetical protein
MQRRRAMLEREPRNVHEQLHYEVKRRQQLREQREGM